MAQNRSSAVMASRVEAPDGLDYFPTPPWATRALREVLVAHGGERTWRYEAQMDAWEPACGEGDMVRPLREFFRQVCASDVYPDWIGASPLAAGAARPLAGYQVYDFLAAGDLLAASGALPILAGEVDWLVSNPPFNAGAEFVATALGLAGEGVAMLTRMQFLESDERYRALYRQRPPALIAQFVERVPMGKGRVDPKLSSATAYCWLVWASERRSPQGAEVNRRALPTFAWIAPCRARLERPGDYWRDPEWLAELRRKKDEATE